MKAIAFDQPGGPEALHLVERPRPVPAAGEVLIRVVAAGVNRVDVLQRLGRYTPPHGPKDIPGVEVSGVVEARGSGAQRFNIGDPVCALVIGGGYAEFVSVPEGQVLPIPGELDFIQAAAVPETFFTVWAAQYDHGHLLPGESLLVHGGSSGIGTTSIQLALLEGAKVVVTAGSAKKCDFCVKLGASSAINYNEQDFVAGVKEATAGHGADVILDMVGGKYAKRNIESLAMDGRLAHLSGGDGTEFSVAVSAIMAKRAVVTGSQLRVSALSLKTEIVRQVTERVWPHLGTKVTPIIDSIMPLADAAGAHARMETSVHIGKILLEVTH